MATDVLITKAALLNAQAEALAAQSKALLEGLSRSAELAAVSQQGTVTVWLLLSLFVMAGFVGYYVILKVTPALHSPLMSVSNAISGIVIGGALITAGFQSESSAVPVFGFLAVVLTAINVFGGFLITHRMLTMFQKKEK